MFELPQGPLPLLALSWNCGISGSHVVLIHECTLGNYGIMEVWPQAHSLEPGVVRPSLFAFKGTATEVTCWTTELPALAKNIGPKKSKILKCVNTKTKNNSP